MYDQIFDTTYFNLKLRKAESNSFNPPELSL